MKLFFNNASSSWRCRLPPATQWAMWYNSGIPSPLNLLLLTNTTNLYWKFMGLSADGAAFQMLTLRWVYPNTEKSVKFVKTQHDMVTFTPTGHYFFKGSLLVLWSEKCVSSNTSPWLEWSHCTGHALVWHSVGFVPWLS